MSYAFWPYLQDSTSPLPGNGSTLISHVLGFLETYIHLIQHESDMYLAHEHHLIPFNISFLAFISFIEHFSGDALLPTTIHRRYPLGEFSLSPLNTCTILTRAAGTTPLPLQRHLQPLLRPHPLPLRCFSVALGAMQVELGVRSIMIQVPNKEEDRGLQSILMTFQWFAIESMNWAGILGGLLLLALLGLAGADRVAVVRQWWQGRNKEEGFRGGGKDMA